MSEHTAETIDLQGMLDAKSPALSPLNRLHHLPTPAQQLEQVLETPNLSPADADFAKDWAKREQVRRENFGKEWVTDTRRRSEERGKDVSASMHDDRNELSTFAGRVEDGDSTSGELLARLAPFRERIKRYERAIEALESTEQTIAGVEQDPEGHFYAFYGKYAALADRLPTLVDALNERQATRRH